MDKDKYKINLGNLTGRKKGSVEDNTQSRFSDDISNEDEDAFDGKKYKYLEVLGKGGFGTVYKAFDPIIERTVAIKKLNIEKSLKQEANCGKLVHPNIVQIYHVFGNCIVMEYIEGEHLQATVEKMGKGFAWKEAYKIIYQLVDAIAYIHQKKLIHRDIKPSNIMLTNKREVKVLDFGISMLFSENSSTTSSETGTSEFMAPELDRIVELVSRDTQNLEKGKEVFAPRTEIFSLGVTFYFLLTGQIPEKNDALYSGQKIDEIENIPQDFKKILKKMLKKDAQERYSSGIKLKEDLEKRNRNRLIIRVLFSLFFIGLIFSPWIAKSLSGTKKKISTLPILKITNIPDKLDKRPFVKWKLEKKYRGAKVKVIITKNNGEQIIGRANEGPFYQIEHYGKIKLQIVVMDGKDRELYKSQIVDIEVYSDSYARIQATKQLLVGVHIDDMSGPFCRKNGDDFEGFDIELVKKIAKALENKLHVPIKVKFIKYNWNDIVIENKEQKKTNENNYKELDFVIASMSITPIRKKYLLFSDSYFTTEIAIIHKKGAEKYPTSKFPIKKLEGYQLGVHKGTTAVNLANDLQKICPKLDIESYPDNQALWNSLINGNGDGVLYDYARGLTAVKREQAWCLQKLDYNVKQEKYGIAFGKINDRLHTAVNRIIKEFKAKNIILGLKKKHIDSLKEKHGGR